MMWPPAYRELSCAEGSEIGNIARAHYMCYASRLMYWMIFDRIKPTILAASKKPWSYNCATIAEGNMKARVQLILDLWDPHTRVQPTRPGWYKARWGGLTTRSNLWVCLKVDEGCTGNGLCVTDRHSDCGVPTTRVEEWGAEIPMPEND